MKQVRRIRTLFFLLIAGLLSFSQSFAAFHACEMMCCKADVLSAAASTNSEAAESIHCCDHSTSKLVALTPCCCKTAELSLGPEREVTWQIRVLESTSADYLREPLLLGFPPVWRPVRSRIFFPEDSAFRETILESRRSRAPPVA